MYSSRIPPLTAGIIAHAKRRPEERRSRTRRNRGTIPARLSILADGVWPRPGRSPSRSRGTALLDRCSPRPTSSPRRCQKTPGLSRAGLGRMMPWTRERPRDSRGRCSRSGPGRDSNRSDATRPGTRDHRTRERRPTGRRWRGGPSLGRAVSPGIVADTMQRASQRPRAAAQGRCTVNAD